MAGRTTGETLDGGRGSAFVVATMDATRSWELNWENTSAELVPTPGYGANFFVAEKEDETRRMDL